LLGILKELKEYKKRGEGTPRMDFGRSLLTCHAEFW